MWRLGRGVAMKLTTGLTVSLAVLVTGLYTWGISTDPEGFGGLIREHARPIEGAVPLSTANTPADGSGDRTSGVDEGVSWKTIGEKMSQAVVFKLRPPDASGLDESFLMYLDGLKSAVETRDIEGVLSYSAGDIVVTHGHLEGSGSADFKQLMSSDGGGKIWAQLHDLLSVPMAKGADGAYCAPWFSCLAMPEEAGVVEPFETVFVIGDNVPVYAAPSTRSEQLVRLSFDAVRLSGTIDDANWVKVILPADRTGYIARDQVRMMFDTRADFEVLESGLWAMTSLVVGD